MHKMVLDLSSANMALKSFAVALFPGTFFVGMFLIEGKKNPDEKIMFILKHGIPRTHRSQFAYCQSTKLLLN